MLQVLKLQSSSFYGPIEPPRTSEGFLKLSLIDLSSNRFTGNLPAEYFGRLKEMMSTNVDTTSERYYNVEDFYYKESVTFGGREIIIQGFMLSSVVALDLSNNRFHGEIPKVIGDLTSIRALNLSHNNLTGQIPSLFANMLELESLHLSCNKLSVRIPP
ncbi:receptor-like protein 35 [Telopea speciosissima]|uniref:receptor-like protein 35 n=1 Tax=Telopea speciosissima TaxID=54955 RepID=UPI001CC5BB41|nr:receptor-like protein 35 [Telopea speciosissima]